MQLETQLNEKKVEAIFTESLKKYLAKNGFDPQMGARPMARLIQDTIRRALADELLFGKLANGGRVTIDLDDKGQVVLDVAQSAQPAEPAEAT
jgi:ATP-dependent Clp protease ATP-binding subunit ClpA